MTRRRKPSDPALLAAQRLARKRVVDDLQSKGIEVNHDEEFRIIVAYRLDVFSTLHSTVTTMPDGSKKRSLSDTGLYAARRLEALHALAMGYERPEQTMDRVDSCTVGAPGQNVTQAMIDADADLEAVCADTGALNARLLMALISEQSAILTRWRDTVKRITGEANDKAQAALIRSACENLALAWQKLDYRARERREKAA